MVYRQVNARKKRYALFGALGHLAVQALPGLITLGVQGISSLIKHHNQKNVNKAILELQENNDIILNRLQQYENDFLLYGKYSLGNLQKVINTTNGMHRRLNMLEQLFQSQFRGDNLYWLDAVGYSSDLNMFIHQRGTHRAIKRTKACG